MAILLQLIAMLQLSAFAGLPSHFEGQNLPDGKPTQIETHFSDKKGLIVVFLSARCPCSNSHVTLLNKMKAQYADFRFVAVHSNSDEPVKEAQDYFKLVQLSFPVVQDTKAKIADALKALKTPHAYVISPEGKILYQGGVTNSSMADESDRNYLAEALDDIQKKQNVRTPEGRTLGCSISREENKNVW